MSEETDAINSFSTAANSLINLVRDYLKPHNIKKEADAEAYRITTLAKAELKAAQIREDIDKIQNRNLGNILEKAKSYIDDEEKSATNEINVKEDWMLSFLDLAKNVSDEEMQELLAAILAGEFDKPGSFSMRTLQVLRNISSDEAIKFTNLMKYCVITVDKIFVINDDVSKITYVELMELEDAGLVNHSDNQYYLEKTNNVTIVYDGLRAIFTNIKDNKLELRSNACLTRAGQELFNLMTRRSSIDYNVDFFIHYVRTIGDNKKAKFHIDYNQPNS